MVKKNKKKEETKVSITKDNKKTIATKEPAEKKEKISKRIILYFTGDELVRDSLDSVFQKAKETKEKNKKKKEKEEKKEQQRIRREFDAINEMKTANGGRICINDFQLDPIGYDEESGMKVYREDQLNLGKGGNTPLCPFDCDCCF